MVKLSCPRHNDENGHTVVTKGNQGNHSFIADVGTADKLKAVEVHKRVPTLVLLDSHLPTESPCPDACRSCLACRADDTRNNKMRPDMMVAELTEPEQRQYLPYNNRTRRQLACLPATMPIANQEHHHCLSGKSLGHGLGWYAPWPVSTVTDTYSLISFNGYCLALGIGFASCNTGLKRKKHICLYHQESYMVQLPSPHPPKSCRYLLPPTKQTKMKKSCTILITYTS